MRHAKGFTLIELMIVVVIIGILAAIGIPNFIALVGRAREGATKANMHTLQVAAEDYAVTYDGVYAPVMDATHIADRLPSNFKNPFTGTGGSGVAWEDRVSITGPPSFIPGISSYADSSNNTYNIKGYGQSILILWVATAGQ
ncbi:MAG TPA: prepilin-type N-terminal cleavage/methylation domain-containing protein [Candidatus Eisenbacteria bacterium]